MVWIDSVGLEVPGSSPSEAETVEVELPVGAEPEEREQQGRPEGEKEQGRTPSEEKKEGDGGVGLELTHEYHEHNGGFQAE